jgi:hypothetical protein
VSCIDRENEPIVELRYVAGEVPLEAGARRAEHGLVAHRQVERSHAMAVLTLPLTTDRDGRRGLAFEPRVMKGGVLAAGVEWPPAPTERLGVTA